MERVGRRDERGNLASKVAYSVVTLTLLAAVGAYLDIIPHLSSPANRPTDVVVGPPASGPGLDLEAPPEPALVLGPAPVARVVRSAIDTRLGNAVDDPALGRRVGVAVARLDVGRPVWQFGAETVVTPASTLKLLTTTAALTAMGPGQRFTTSVVRGVDRRTLVLVGGGDPLLTDKASPRSGDTAPYPRPASLAELAADTATQLTGNEGGRVRLRYDASLFSGPPASPAWEPSYLPESIVSPISALWVDEGRQDTNLALRVADPGQVAAKRFAALLRARGVVVTGAVEEESVSDNARTVAAVESPRLSLIVQHVVETSDNEAAEVLLRQTALAEELPASFTAGVKAVTSVLTELGVDLSGARLDDGSGLARSDRLPLSALVQVLQIAASPEHPELRSVVSALPVAGFTGSLESRFFDSAPGGLGLVRAKTGTLTGVHGLAGIVTTADGETLVFAAVADRVPVVKTLAARAQLERIAARLVRCGC